MQGNPYDVEVIVEGCPPASSSGELMALISRWAAKGAFRFLITLRDAGFSECIDLLRDSLQGFLFASFTVREGGEPAGVVRVRVRPSEEGMEVIERWRAGWTSR